jgi:hypothetical protein
MITTTKNLQGEQTALTATRETGTPEPSETFAENYREYLRLISIEPKSRSFDEQEAAKNLNSYLEAEFMKAFSLSPDKRKLSSRFYWRFVNTPFAPRDKLFDHVKFFLRGSSLVIVSQPYWLDRAELARWCSDVNASFTIVERWRHYGSPDATLFFVEFAPEARNTLDARIRRHRS